MCNSTHGAPLRTPTPSLHSDRDATRRLLVREANAYLCTHHAAHTGHSKALRATTGDAAHDHTIDLTTLANSLILCALGVDATQGVLAGLAAVHMPNHEEE